MLGKVKSIIHFAPKKRLYSIDVNGVKAKTYVVDGYNNSKKWEKVQVGDRLEGLDWADENSGIIDADSNISTLK
jgi:hypothetical protein